MSPKRILRFPQRPETPEDQALREQARYEVKFVASELLAWKLRHWLRVLPAGFRIAYPPRRVNNVYFDSYDYTTFWENLVGVSSRVKVRYRWYGEALEPGAGVLELKHKRNSLGWKTSFRVPTSPGAAGATWATIRSGLMAALPEAARVWLEAHPLPVLVNSYRREYYVSGDGCVRITLDVDQAVFDQRLRAVPNLTRPANLPRSLVLEVKCDRADRALASSVIQRLPIRVSRHSKYVNGVRAISGT